MADALDDLPEVRELTEEEWAAVPHRRSFDICTKCFVEWPCPDVHDA